MIGRHGFAWAVCDDRFMVAPYIFQDQDKGTQTPAVYLEEERAKEMAAKLNASSKTRHYIVRRW